MPEITLIPFDASSPLHISRLKQQREACGWGADNVDNWADLQRRGMMATFWVVNRDDEASSTIKGREAVEGDVKRVIRRDLDAFTGEEMMLVRGGGSGFGDGVGIGDIKDLKGEMDNRMETQQQNQDSTVEEITEQQFIPVGHISLSQQMHPSAPPPPIRSSAKPTVPKIIVICNLWVSPAVKLGGIGRAAMDVAEKIAVEAPFWASELVLWTIEGVAQRDMERYRALGREKPRVTLQEWYERRGYVTYDRIEGRMDATDDTGKVWHAAAVGMRLVVKP